MLVLLLIEWKILTLYSLWRRTRSQIGHMLMVHSVLNAHPCIWLSMAFVELIHLITQLIRVEITEVEHRGIVKKKNSHVVNSINFTNV